MIEPRLGAAMDIRFGTTVGEFLEFLAGLDLNHVEFKREYLHGHPAAPTPERVAELLAEYDMTVTYHAPFRDWNLGSFNEASRAASVEQVKATLDDAATAGAEAVVVHGGSVPRRYPDWVRKTSRENAIESFEECATYAREVGVPICLENQPKNPQKCRYTTSPSDLEAMLATVEGPNEYVGVTLDVGHATVNGYDVADFVDRFRDRIRVCHLHANDGSADDHDPLPGYESIVEAVPAEVFVFEMKSVADVATCVGADRRPIEASLSTDD